MFEGYVQIYKMYAILRDTEHARTELNTLENDEGVRALLTAIEKFVDGRAESETSKASGYVRERGVYENK